MKFKITKLEVLRAVDKIYADLPFFDSIHVEGEPIEEKKEECKACLFLKGTAMSNLEEIKHTCTQKPKIEKLNSLCAPIVMANKIDEIINYLQAYNH